MSESVTLFMVFGFSVIVNVTNCMTLRRIVLCSSRIELICPNIVSKHQTRHNNKTGNKENNLDDLPTIDLLSGNPH